jgi:catechol 2,3-dioxygenase-like lactoylglutathione lyase family enzyme
VARLAQSGAVCLDSTVTISNIRIVSVPVSDPDRSKEFYVNVLGMEVLQDSPMGESMRWIQLSPKGSEASLALVTWFDAMPAGSLQGLLLDTPDIESAIDEFASKGFTIDAEIDEQPWGRFVTFNDPDGNGIVLRQPPTGEQ